MDVPVDRDKDVPPWVDTEKKAVRVSKGTIGVLHMSEAM